MIKSEIKSLSDIEISQLEELCRFDRFQLRSKIIIFADLGYQPKEIAVRLHCHLDTVWKTIRRWKMTKFEGFNQKGFNSSIGLGGNIGGGKVKIPIHSNSYKTGKYRKTGK